MLVQKPWLNLNLVSISFRSHSVTILMLLAFVDWQPLNDWMEQEFASVNIFEQGLTFRIIFFRDYHAQATTTSR